MPSHSGTSRQERGKDGFARCERRANNKRTAERVIVADQVPLSRNEKIVVKQLTPEAKAVKPTDEGSLKWTLDLKPGEKRELTVKFTIEYANDVNVTGLEP